MSVKFLSNKVVSLSIFILFGLLVGNFVFALEINYPLIPGAEPPQVFIQKIENGIYNENDAFPLYLKYFYHLLIVISGIVCFGSLLLGAFYYLFSLGSTNRMRQGLERMGMAFLGLLIILSSYIIVKTIDPRLTVFELTKPSLPSVTAPTIPDIELKPETYVEVPLGGLIENVEKKSRIADEKSWNLWFEAAEHTLTWQGMTHTSLKELTQCLEILSSKCKCNETETIDCESNCTGGSCKGDPCDRTIDPNLTCGPATGIIVLPNLRDAIGEISDMIEKQIEVVEEKRREAEIARMELFAANNLLKMAEKLVAVSLTPPINYDSMAAFDISLSGANANATINCNQIPDSPPNTDPPPGVLNKDEYFQLVDMWRPGGHPHVMECYNDVIVRSKNAGVNVAFALLIWANESGASNYAGFDYPIEDFGIHKVGSDPDVPGPMDFNAQLDFFLKLPEIYAQICGKRDMETFTARFKSGTCTPTSDSLNYLEGLKNRWNRIAPGLPFPDYPS
jgi:hypothetical protein